MCIINVFSAMWWSCSTIYTGTKMVSNATDRTIEAAHNAYIELGDIPDKMRRAQETKKHKQNIDQFHDSSNKMKQKYAKQLAALEK